MDGSTTPTGPVIGGPLQMATPERVNRRESSMSGVREREDRGESPLLFEKATSPFNSLSMSAHSKLLERKTADAALKRAMVGREEAEADIRKLREENETFRKAVEEGKDRERKVGERLETVMENYGRVKETHSHTQALWEKEIRRARKENFKAQSNIVKLQEELKTARTAAKINEECLQREKERSHVREQEAFTARYNIVGVQEQLEQALERIKVVEQERDAFKTAAKNEEVARIAAEGRLPLPVPDDLDSLSVSNKKLKKRKHDSIRDAPRVSLSAMEIMSSAASEMEIEELSMQVRWERQRADRAQEMIEFLQAECQMHCCPCSKNKSHKGTPQRAKAASSPPKSSVLVNHKAAADEMDHDSNKEEEEPIASIEAEEEQEEELQSLQLSEPSNIRSKKERTSTIFCPNEGVFRIVSEEEAAEISEAEQNSIDDEDLDFLPSPLELPSQAREFARTPSVEPPSLAIMPRERTSLQSLLNAPHEEEDMTSPTETLNIPTISDDQLLPELADAIIEAKAHSLLGGEPIGLPPLPIVDLNSSTRYKVTTTTVPVRNEEEQRLSSFNDKLRTPSSCSNKSFDHNDPALTPTMTREQALAKIRERRGRARSTERTGPTSNKKPQPIPRREVSNPLARNNSRTTTRNRSKNLMK